MARLPAEPPGGLGVTNSSWPLTTTDSWPRRDPKTGTPATIALFTDPAETPGPFTDRRGPTIDRWSQYSAIVWDYEGTQDADLYLVDGRFRVACFIQTLMHCKPDAVILIHDYAPRLARMAEKIQTLVWD